MTNFSEVLKRPLVTEKSIRLAKEHNAYTFEVSKTASEGAIQQMVAKLYGVEVQKVRTITTPGKPKRVWGAGKKFTTVATKKAIVVLKPGDQIPGFETDSKD